MIATFDVRSHHCQHCKSTPLHHPTAPPTPRIRGRRWQRCRRAGSGAVLGVGPSAWWWSANACVPAGNSAGRVLRPPSTQAWEHCGGRRPCCTLSCGLAAPHKQTHLDTPINGPLRYARLPVPSPGGSPAAECWQGAAHMGPATEGTPASQPTARTASQPHSQPASHPVAAQRMRRVGIQTRGHARARALPLGMLYSDEAPPDVCTSVCTCCV